MTTVSQQHALVFDLDLIKKYDRSGPRYTSYPTAVQFHEGFTEADYRAAAQASNDHTKPLSLYFHLPFCDTVCFYCACNKVVTKDRSKPAEYLQRLYREIEQQSALFSAERPVTQLHWGGGTPTFLSHQEMQSLMQKTGQHFQLVDDDTGEYSIEVDPREASADTIALLREIGFNRLSLGVQDFDPQVQQAVNRIQTEEQTWAVLEAARNQGFRSISLDLMYGLPLQTIERFDRTLEKVIAAAPDRLSVFNYAHLPERFKPQRRINEAELPTPQMKLDILQHCIHRLTSAGYVYIGMDHFARPDDELAQAQRNGTLYRNFQGYSTHADCDLVALGVTSISMVGPTYAQNLRSMDDYLARLDNGQLAIFRGVRLNADDQVRRSVIMELICHFRLDFAAIEQQWQIDFRQYFAAELQRLHELAADGLLQLSDQGIQVLPAGRLLIRNICMLFDAYLSSRASSQSFSKVI